MSVDRDPNENDRGPSGAEVLASLITDALEKAKLGKTKDYDLLVQKLADPGIKEVHLQRYLMALTTCVSHLTKQYDTLVGAVLNTRWALCGEKTVEEFIEFLTSLVSAQTYYLRACLNMIVKLFIPSIFRDVQVEKGDSEVSEKIFCNAHEALHAIHQVVPAVPQFLISVLSENFPFVRKPTIFQESYVKNLLQATKYLPSLRANILELIIDNLTKIDVAVPKHELEHHETTPEEEDPMQFEVEMDATNIAVEDSGEGQEVNCMGNEMADRLDILMEILFKYIHEVTHIDGEYIVDGGIELFNELLVIFDKVILPTHASCHIQFIMFLLCSFDQYFSNSLLDVCWKKIEEPNTPAIIRQASAAYIASFTARAKYIPISTVQTCLDLIVHWIHCYIDTHDASCVTPDAGKYGPFYSVCQALFYMFVFRHKQLLELEGGLKYIRRLNLDRIVTCRMNPLRVCLPSIVKLFAYITRHYELVFCYTIIEQNNRMMLPVATTASSHAVRSLSFQNQLDSYFPFDPYLLKRSSKFIKPLYHEWKELEHDADDDDDDEEEDDQRKHSETYDEGEDYLDSCSSPDGIVPGFTPDTHMCVSPGFTVSPRR